MIRSRGFALITGADFVVRSAYQMGKSPLLPIYAAALGAGDVFLGFIVSVSTLTGMVLKPTFGMLSDRSGRRLWLLVGTVFFAGMPFVYRFVTTPEQLFAVRMVHGLATAIYGPVTLAYVAELSQKRRAERIGWFSTARSAGYVVGPAVAGWMLQYGYAGPVGVFTVIGLLSAAAFIPVLLLPETARAPKARVPLRRQVVAALGSGARSGAVWLAGGMEAGIYIAVYAVKAFVPLLALSSGAGVLAAGAFLSVQEAVHIVCKPFGGRLGDRIGFVTMAVAGMVVLGAALLLLPISATGAVMIVSAVLIGVAQAIVFPSTVALVSARVDAEHLATGMGLVGSMKNAGKVAGPIIAGFMIHWLDYTYTFAVMGSAVLAAAVIVWATLQGSGVSLRRPTTTAARSSHSPLLETRLE